MSNAGYVHGVTIKQLNFSDCHRGKGACHRKEVTVKAHMTVYLIEGDDFENAGQMIDTTRLSGGIPGLNSPSVS